MRAEDHRVPRLDGHDALEENGGSGVGDGREREDDADGLGHFDQAALRILANDADGAFVLDVVVDELGGHHVLEGLVFQNADASLFDRQSREILGLLQAGNDHRLDDAVDVLLRVLGKDGGSSSGLADQPFQVSDTLFAEGFGILGHTHSSFT